MFRWRGDLRVSRLYRVMERRFSNLRLLMERRLPSLLWYPLRALPIPDPAESKRGICLFGAMRLNLNPRRAAGTAEIAQRFKLLYTEIYRDNSTEQLFSLLFSCPKIYDARAKATSCFSCSPVRKSMMREPRRRPPVSPVLLSGKYALSLTGEQEQQEILSHDMKKIMLYISCSAYITIF